MNQIVMNDELIRIKKKEMEFLSYFHARGYDRLYHHGVLNHAGIVTVTGVKDILLKRQGKKNNL